MTTNRWQTLRTDVITGIYNGECNHCKQDDIRLLTIDHKEGGGTQERRTLNNRTLYRRLRDTVQYGTKEVDSSKYQVLCHNCQHLKKLGSKEYQQPA